MSFKLSENCTVEILKMIPKGIVYVCPECGGPKILRRSSRCQKCQSKHALKKAWKAKRNKK